MVDGVMLSAIPLSACKLWLGLDIAEAPTRGNAHIFVVDETWLAFSRS
jgi:hypothetical protein